MEEDCSRRSLETARRLCGCVRASERGVSWVCPARESVAACYKLAECVRGCEGVLRPGLRLQGRPGGAVRAEEECLEECYTTVFLEASRASGRGSETRLRALVARRPWEDPYALFWLCAETGVPVGWF